MSDLLTAEPIAKSRQAFLELRERILDVRLPPGTHLTLHPIAKSLGVTVAAVSEAVRELVHEHLVDFELNYESKVRRFDAETVPSRLFSDRVISSGCWRLTRCLMKPHLLPTAPMWNVLRRFDHTISISPKKRCAIIASDRCSFKCDGRSA